MNLFVHLKIAARICDLLEHAHHIKINRWGFYWGNILPDLQHNRIPVDHFFVSSWPTIRSLSEQICSEGDPVPAAGLTPFHSVNIGMICHFISDYFCHAHTEAFGSGRVRHLVYEAQMMPVSLKTEWLIRDQDLALLPDGHTWEQNLMQALAEHHLETPSMLRDIQLAIAQGTQLAARLSLKDIRSEAYDRALAYEPGISAEPA
ncbi:MAG: zinc dependent phospholipase C family protein [Eubacteriales bacterium]|nr:zinc dependent phospholipase C family protein [Eubacteriales bacterium]